MGPDVEIGAAAHRTEEGARGVAPAPVVHRELVVADAFLIAAVVVGVARVAAGDRRLDEGVGHFVRLVLIGDHEGTAGGAGVADPGSGGALEVLGLAKVGQHGFVRPAAIAELGPDVVVERLTPHVEHAVDGAGSAQCAAPRNGNAPSVDVVLGLGLEAPVVASIVHQLRKPDRNRDPGTCVPAARLQQEHALRCVLGQPIGKHAPGRSGADDDVVVVAHVQSLG